MDSKTTQKAVLLLKILLSALSVFVVVIAGHEIQLQNKFAKVSGASKAIERGAGLGSSTVSKIALLADEMVIDDVCRSDLLRSGTTLVLRRLELQNVISNYDSWMEAATKADAFIRHALTCMPTQGNFWVRLAEVRQQVSEDPAEIARLVVLSRSYAPAEAVAIRGRLLIAGKASVPTLQQLQEPLLADLKTLCIPKYVSIVRGLPAPAPKAARFINAIRSHADRSRDAWCGFGLAWTSSK